jgi:hypothetical protein
VYAAITSGDDMTIGSTGDVDDKAISAIIDAPYGYFYVIYPVRDRAIKEHVVTLSIDEAPVCEVTIQVPHRDSPATVTIRSPCGSKSTCALFVRQAGGGQGWAITLRGASKAFLEKADRWGRLCYWQETMRIGPA